MVRPLRPQPHARSIIEPQAAPFWLFARHFQPLPSPDQPHTLDVHAPTFVDQHPADPTIAVASIPHRQPLDRRRKCRLIIANSRTTALRRPRLTDNPTGPAFRDGNPGAHMRNAGTSAGRAQYFPSRASFRISLSSVSSDTAFFRRWFSRSRSFRRLA